MSYRTQQAPDEAVRQLPVVNTTGEDVPAFALMLITGIDADGALLVGQPSVDGQTNLLINGPVPIPPGAHGQGHSASPAAVLYDDADGIPAAGETWGAAAGSWKARKGKAGALVVGGTDAAAKLTNALHLWGLAPAVGGPLAAREVDGSPSVSPVTTLRFDQAAGLRVSSPFAGAADVTLQQASVSLVGYVSTGAQAFAGLKDFTDGLHANGVTIDADTSLGEVWLSGYDDADPGINASWSVEGTLAGSLRNIFFVCGAYGATPQNYWRLNADGFQLAGGAFMVGAAAGQSVTDSGVTYTGGIRTGGALNVTAAVSAALAGLGGVTLNI